MTADNWAECPRCVARAKKAEADQLAAVMDSYGKITLAEFDAALAAIKPVREADLKTFSEIYEIYGAASGKVTVSYGGYCNTCGLSLQFEDVRPIEGVNE